jgi:hypothetical protein
VFLAVPMDPSAVKIERGKFLVRNIVGTSQEHGALAVAHHPKVGDTVGLVLRDAVRARNNLKETLEELAARLAAPPVFGLYFDCVSRGSGLYNIPGHDSAYIRQYLGEVPIGGFFTGFEIGPAGEQTSILGPVLLAPFKDLVVPETWIRAAKRRIPPIHATEDYRSWTSDFLKNKKCCGTRPSAFWPTTARPNSSAR